MDELLNKYIEKFDANFPLFMFKGVDDQEIINIIEKCINENKPYETEIEKGVLY